MTDMKQEIVDAIENGSIGDKLFTPLSAEEIDALVEKAKVDAGAPFESEAIARMAATRRADRATFMRLRARLKDAKIKISELDKMLDKAHTEGDDTGDEDDEGKAGKPLNLAAPEPWHEPVDGAVLLDEMVAQIERYVMLPREAATAIALWIVHCHGFELFPITPRLLILSPTPRCGKTRLIEILERLVPKALRADNISAASLFRVVEKSQPVVLIDEADSFLKDSEDHRNIVNSGHARGGAVVSLVGEDFEPRRFSTFAPVVLASIGGLASTIMDRSIVIIMRRRMAKETVDRFRGDRAGHLAELARKVARFVADYKYTLSDADPDMPEALHDRACDNWRPLLAIADHAAGDWPQKARAAAQTLSTQGAEQDEQSPAVMLLADIKRIFDEKAKKGGKDADRVSSTKLVDALIDLDDRPWASWWKGKPITPARVAQLLKSFRIIPNTIKLSDGKQPNGYKLDQFRDAFGRYLSQPPGSPVQSSPSSPTPTKMGVSGQSQSSPQGASGELPKQAQSIEKYEVGEHGELPEPEIGGWHDNGHEEDDDEYILVPVYEE